MPEWFLSWATTIWLSTTPIGYMPTCISEPPPNVSDQTCVFRQHPQGRQWGNVELDWTINNVDGTFPINFANLEIQETPPRIIAQGLCLDTFDGVFNPVTGEPVTDLPGWGVTMLILEDPRPEIAILLISRASLSPRFNLDGSFSHCVPNDDTPPFPAAIHPGVLFTRVVP